MAMKLHGVMMEPLMVVRIDALLRRSDSRSEWIRDAIETKLKIEEEML